MVSEIGMLNTIFSLVFPGLVTAFGTFLMRQAYMGLPKDLEDAARLDGCNIGQTFLYVMLPLTKSSMVALGIFTALFGFKDLMWPLIANTEQSSMPLAAALAKIQGQFSANYPELMAACRTLWEYAEYTDRVRRYAKELPIAEAVERAITECIREGILKEFLRKNRAEAKRMSIYEYDQEKHLRQEREASWEKGREAGKEEGMKLLDDLYGLLAKSGRIDDILRATKEPEYRDKLLQEFLGR